MTTFYRSLPAHPLYEDWMIDHEVKLGCRCEITRNPLGTDTWMEGHSCQCKNCQEYVRTGLRREIDW